ncbi:MAG: ATP-dependent Clp protease proteolytic subunit [Aestuariivirga sp.]
MMKICGSSPVCISFLSPVDSLTASVLLAAVTEQTNRGCDDIHLFLSTPGGGVADGIAVYNVLSTLPVHLTTYNVGTVDSIGNVIYMAGKVRVAFPASRFMFHGVGFDIQSARFELKDVKERIAAIQNDQSLIADVLVKHSNLGIDDVNKLFLEAAFIRANDAHERGIAHEVREIRLPKGVPIVQLVFQR